MINWSKIEFCSIWTGLIIIIFQIETTIIGFILSEVWLLFLLLPHCLKNRIIELLQIPEIQVHMNERLREEYSIYLSCKTSDHNVVYFAIVVNLLVNNKSLEFVTRN